VAGKARTLPILDLILLQRAAFFPNLASVFPKSDPPKIPRGSLPEKSVGHE
jgi:hypothetical protein